MPQWASQALDVALAGQALAVSCGVAILLYAAAWHTRHPVAADPGRSL